MPNKSLFITALASPTLAHAAQSDSTSMLTVFLSLFLILGGFILVALLLRRYLPGAGRQGVVKLVGSTAVGARERVVVVEIDDAWLVLGVGAGQVTLLDKRAKPAKPVSVEGAHRE
jgi:flagellar protein FliO/FliZ